jgi:hypothetical protein
MEDQLMKRTMVGKPEGKKALGIARCRWVDNVKMDLREIEWGGMGWIDLAQDRDQWRGSCERGNEPLGSMNEKFLSRH